MESIPFSDAMRNIRSHIGPEPLEKRQIEARGRNPVHVIIAIETYQLSIANFLVQTIDRLLHVRKQERVMEDGVQGRQPSTRLFYRGHPTSHEDRGGNRRDGK